MRKKDYSELISEIMQNVGGKDNIESILHCSTRLRINIKDKSKVNESAFKNMEGCVDGRWSNGQFQVIIGIHVRDVYAQMCSTYGFEAQESIDENLDDIVKKKSIKDMLKGILPAVADCCAGVITPLIGMSIINLIIQILLLANVLSPENGTVNTISWMWETTLLFLPVLVGFTASKRFHTNSALAILIAGLMIAPRFTELVTNGEPGTIFGLPIFAGTYTSTIFPVIIIVFVLSKIEKLIKKYTPVSLNLILVPSLCLLIMLPLTFVVLAPLGQWLGNLVGNLIHSINSTSHVLAVAIYAALRPILVFTGMHVSLNGIFMPELIQNGFIDNLFIMPVIMCNFVQGACGLAVGVKTKDKKLKTTAFSSGVQPFLIGITEPVLLGINVPLKTPLYCSIIASGIGGIMLGLFNVYTYTMIPNGGVLGFTAYLGGETANFAIAIIASVVAAILGFILTLITYKEKEQ